MSSSSTTDPRVQYLELRARVQGVKLGGGKEDIIFVSENVCDDAFAHALKNLNSLIKEFGEKSKPVLDWISAQDKVFGAEIAVSFDPDPALPDANPVIKWQRAYQLASARFYQNDMVKAKELFVALADDRGFGATDLAWYMAARATVKAALNGNDDQDLADAEKYTRELIARCQNSAYRDDLVDLLESLCYGSDRQLNLWLIW